MNNEGIKVRIFSLDRGLIEYEHIKIIKNVLGYDYVKCKDYILYRNSRTTDRYTTLAWFKVPSGNDYNHIVRRYHHGLTSIYSRFCKSFLSEKEIKKLLLIGYKEVPGTNELVYLLEEWIYL